MPTKRFRDRYERREEDGCEAWATDSPATEIQVRTDNAVKKIYHYDGGTGFEREADLIKLEDALDEIFDTAKLISPARGQTG